MRIGIGLKANAKPNNNNNNNSQCGSRFRGVWGDPANANAKPHDAKKIWLRIYLTLLGLNNSNLAWNCAVDADGVRFYPTPLVFNNANLVSNCSVGAIGVECFLTELELKFYIYVDGFFL